MSLGRKALLVVSSTLLAFFLLAAALDFGLVKIVGSPEPIKKILADSDIYKSLVSNGLDAAKKTTSDSGEVGLNDPAVRAAAEATFTPQFLQNTANQTIDSIYAWLNGQTTEPDFNIDLNSVKNTFADKVAEAARQKAASLPVCTGPVDTNTSDPFSLTCLPPGLTPDQVATDVRSTIINGEGFLDNPVISADSVKTAGSNVSIFASDLKETPRAFQGFKSTPTILAVLAFLALIMVFFLSANRLTGLRHIGFNLLGVGIFLIIFGLAANTAVKNKVIPAIKLDSSVLQTNIRTIVYDVVHNIDGTYLLIGTIYTSVGALAVGGVYYIHRKHPPAGILRPASETESTATAPPVVKPKPKPPKKTRKKIKVS